MPNPRAAATSRRKAPGITHEAIIRDVRAGNIKPLYFLMGAEGYYIDHLAEFLVDTLVKPEERDFNLITFYGLDTDVETIVNAARGYPMGGERLVILVREAQRLEQIELLEHYTKQIQPTTVLIICYMGGKIDMRTRLAQSVERVGVLYESKTLSDYQLPTFIRNYLTRRHATIDDTAAAMMAEHVGSDLNRMASELDKLLIGVGPGARITPMHVEQQVGISKDYNIFELQDALGTKNVLKAMRIADYFDKNPKVGNLQKILPSLFAYFRNVMLAYYAPDRSERSVADWLGIADWQARRNVLPALERYSGVKVMKIIGEIRRTDARSKGVDCPATPSGELMRELLYFILH